MLRNFIFSLFFFTGIIVISIIFLPSFFLPKQVVIFGGKLMGHWTGFCLKFFLSTKIIIKGIENIIKDEVSPKPKKLSRPKKEKEVEVKKEVAEEKKTLNRAANDPRNK